MDMPGDQPGIPEHNDMPPECAPDSGAVLRQHLVALRRTNRALRLLTSINQALMHATLEEDLIRQTCDIAVNMGAIGWHGWGLRSTTRHGAYAQSAMLDMC